MVKSAAWLQWLSQMDASAALPRNHRQVCHFILQCYWEKDQYALTGRLDKPLPPYGWDLCHCLIGKKRRAKEYITFTSIAKKTDIFQLRRCTNTPLKKETKEGHKVLLETWEFCQFLNWSRVCNREIFSDFLQQLNWNVVYKILAYFLWISCVVIRNYTLCMHRKW